MSKRVYISADYSETDGDRSVVEELHKWGSDNRHKVDYVDTAQVVSGSVSKDENCRACDLKAEFNRQINASSVVIFIVGDKTKTRTAGSTCRRVSEGMFCACTPYKQNVKGTSICKIIIDPCKYGPSDDVCKINTYSYIKHEFEQAKKKKKVIVVVYNSLYKQPSWLPPFMSDYGKNARPFWKKNIWGEKVGDYSFIKKTLGYE